MGNCAMMKPFSFEKICYTFYLILFGIFFNYADGIAEVNRSDISLEEVMPAVVRISGYMADTEGEQLSKYAETSGFFFNEKGYILAAYRPYVTAETRLLCEKFEVHLYNGETLSAAIFAVDPVLNLAILKLKQDGNYPTLTLSDKAPPQVGDQVWAIAGKQTGNEALSFPGQVKAPNKNSIYEDGCGDLLINTYMQLPDYAYGGPLMNKEGAVIGINIPYTHPEAHEDSFPGEEHPVPISEVTIIAKVLYAFPTFEQNWIGFSVRRLTQEERAAAKHLIRKRDGIAVDFVWEDGPAKTAGILPGDIITKMNGQRVLTMIHFRTQIFKAQRHSLANLSIIRNGSPLVIQTQIEKRPLWAAP